MGVGLHGFVGDMGPVQALAAELGVAAHTIALHRFPDGESLVQVQPQAGTAILYRSLHDPNAKLVEILLAAAALRDGGAGRVLLVAPYLGYMRQDMAFAPGQAVSQRVIGALLADHFDGVLTVDPHLHRISALTEVMPTIPAVSLSAAGVLGASIVLEDRPIIAGPDAESRQWVEALAAPLGLPVLLGHKERSGDRDVAIAFDGIAQVAGRRVILVDDVISSGATLACAARALLAAGARRVEALATHCLASAADLAALAEAGIARIVSTESVPGPTAQLSLARLLAGEIIRLGWTEQGGDW